MAKTVSWMWKGKRYYGTLIRETKTHKFARTKNGKIKKKETLAIIVLVAAVIQRGMNILGVSLPDKM